MTPAHDSRRDLFFFSFVYFVATPLPSTNYMYLQSRQTQTCNYLASSHEGRNEKKKKKKVISP